MNLEWYDRSSILELFTERDWSYYWQLRYNRYYETCFQGGCNASIGCPISMHSICPVLVSDRRCCYKEHRRI